MDRAAIPVQGRCTVGESLMVPSTHGSSTVLAHWVACLSPRRGRLRLPRCRHQDGTPEIGLHTATSRATQRRRSDDDLATRKWPPDDPSPRPTGGDLRRASRRHRYGHSRVTLRDRPSGRAKICHQAASARRDRGPGLNRGTDRCAAPSPAMAPSPAARDTRELPPGQRGGRKLPARRAPAGGRSTRRWRRSPR
jgi:hypothetical protein